MNNFKFPNIDHLIEGVHYTLVEWDFAEEAKKVKSAKECKEGQRVVFGRCVDAKTTEDKDVSKIEEEQRKKSGQVTNTGGPVNVKGQKMGWAIKDGKPVLVDWGSVAGEKKPQATPPSGGSPAPAPATPAPGTPPAAQPPK